MPDARAPEGSITLNGETFVPLVAWEAERDAKGRHSRTLALAHMYLVLDGERGRDEATHVIQRDTGYRVEDARAVASVVAWARGPKPSSCLTCGDDDHSTAEHSTLLDAIPDDFGSEPGNSDAEERDRG